MKCQANVLEDVGHVRVLRSELLFVYCERATVVLQGSWIIAFVAENPCQVIKQCGDLGMLHPKPFFRDGKGAPIVAKAGFVISHIIGNVTQVAQKGTQVGMFWAECLFLNLERPLMG